MIVRDPQERDTYQNIWVMAEHAGGEVACVTGELIGAATGLARARSSQVWVLVLGEVPEEERDRLFAWGADVVLGVFDKRLDAFCEETLARVACRLLEEHRPEVVLCPATSRGRALAPRLAVLACCGLTADCTGLAIDGDTGDLLQTRPAFGGNLMATIRSSDHRPQMATVRPRVMTAPPPDPSRRGRVIREELREGEICRRKEFLGDFPGSGGGVNLADARIIVAGGRGMEGPEGFRLLSDLAKTLGGVVGASRAAVDAGWIPYGHQVGQTGQTVQTEVYIACGISGQIQHLVGMNSCDLIIAIDKDPDTPMMQMADIALEGDLFEVVPRLIGEVRAL